MINTDNRKFGRLFKAIFLEMEVIKSRSGDFAFQGIVDKVG